MWLHGKEPGAESTAARESQLRGSRTDDRTSTHEQHAKLWDADGSSTASFSIHGHTNSTGSSAARVFEAGGHPDHNGGVAGNRNSNGGVTLLSKAAPSRDAGGSMASTGIAAFSIRSPADSFAFSEASAKAINSAHRNRQVSFAGSLGGDITEQSHNSVALPGIATSYSAAPVPSNLRTSQPTMPNDPQSDGLADAAADPAKLRFMSRGSYADNGGVIRRRRALSDLTGAPPLVHWLFASAMQKRDAPWRRPSKHEPVMQPDVTPPDGLMATSFRGSIGALGSIMSPSGDGAVWAAGDGYVAALEQQLQEKDNVLAAALRELELLQQLQQQQGHVGQLRQQLQQGQEQRQQKQQELNQATLALQSIKKHDKPGQQAVVTQMQLHVVQLEGVVKPLEAVLQQRQQQLEEATMLLQQQEKQLVQLQERDGAVPQLLQSNRQLQQQLEQERRRQPAASQGHTASVAGSGGVDMQLQVQKWEEQLVVQAAHCQDQVLALQQQLQQREEEIAILRTQTYSHAGPEALLEPLPMPVHMNAAFDATGAEGKSRSGSTSAGKEAQLLSMVAKAARRSTIALSSRSSVVRSRLGTADDTMLEQEDEFQEQINTQHDDNGHRELLQEEQQVDLHALVSSGRPATPAKSDISMLSPCSLLPNMTGSCGSFNDMMSASSGPGAAVWREVLAREREARHMIKVELEHTRANLVASQGTASLAEHIRDVSVKEALAKASAAETRVTLLQSKLAETERKLSVAEGETTSQRHMSICVATKAEAEADTGRRMKLQVTAQEGTIVVLTQQLASAKSELAAAMKRLDAQEEAARKLEWKLQEHDLQSSSNSRAAAEQLDAHARRHLAWLMELRNHPLLLLPEPGTEQQQQRLAALPGEAGQQPRALPTNAMLKLQARASQIQQRLSQHHGQPSRPSDAQAFGSIGRVTTTPIAQEPVNMSQAGASGVEMEGPGQSYRGSFAISPPSDTAPPGLTDAPGEHVDVQANGMVGADDSDGLVLPIPRGSAVRDGLQPQDQDFIDAWWSHQEYEQGRDSTLNSTIMQQQPNQQQHAVTMSEMQNVLPIRTSLAHTDMTRTSIQSSVSKMRFTRKSNNGLPAVEEGLDLPDLNQEQQQQPGNRNSHAMFNMGQPGSGVGLPALASQQQQQYSSNVGTRQGSGITLPGMAPEPQQELPGHNSSVFRDRHASSLSLPSGDADYSAAAQQALDGDSTYDNPVWAEQQEE